MNTFERAAECAITCQGYLPLLCCGEFCERLANQRAKAVPPVPDERGVSVDNPQPDQLRTTTDAASSSPQPFMYEDDLPEYMTKEEYSDWYAKSWVDGVRMGPVFGRKESVAPQDGEFSQAGPATTAARKDGLAVATDPVPEDWILKAARLAREGEMDLLVRHLLDQEKLHRQQLQNEFTAGEDSGRTEVELFYKGIEGA